MELYQLKYFRTLCRYEKYSRAAQELFISPSALTTAVKKMEAEIGLPLIDRTGGGFSLTPAGQELLHCADVVLQELDILQEKMDALASQKILLRIAVEHMAFSGAFMESLDAFSRAYPDVELSLSRREGDSIRQLVSDQKLDFGVVIHASSEEEKTADNRARIRRPNLDTEPYCQVEYGLYCREALSEKAVPTQAMAGKTLTLLNYTGDMAQPLDRYFSRYGVRLASGSITNIYPDTAWQLIREGLGLAVYPLDLRSVGDNLYVYPFDPPLLLNYDFVMAVHSSTGRAVSLLNGFLRQNADSVS